MKNMKQTRIIPITINDEEMTRENKTYKEIEKFEKYELTTCIAYEMAIRNSVVDEKLKKLELLVKFEEEHPYLELEESDDTILGVSEDRLQELIKLLSLPSGLLLIELEKMIDKKKSKAFDNELYKEILNKESFDNIVKKVYKDESFWTTSNTTKISTSAIYHMQSFLENDLIYNHYIYPKSATVEIQGSNEPYYFDNETHSAGTLGSSPKIDNYDGDFFVKIQNDGTSGLNFQISGENYEQELFCLEDEKPKQFEINTIIQTFKRRMYEPRTSLLSLNFSKSLEENIEYLKVIYKHFDKSDKKIVKTPLEYIGIELKIETINYKNMSASEWQTVFLFMIFITYLILILIL